MPKLIKGHKPQQNLTAQSEHLVLVRLPSGLFVLRHRAAKKDTPLGTNPAVLFELQELIDLMLATLEEETRGDTTKKAARTGDTDTGAC